MSNQATDVSLTLTAADAGRYKGRVDGLQGPKIRQIVIATAIVSWCGLLALFGVI